MRFFLGMMPRLFIIILFFNSVVQGVSGNSPDSLEAVLKLTPVDSSKALLCNQFARNALVYYKQTDDYYQALEYAERGLEYAKKANFSKGEAELYRTMGSICFFMNNFDSAIKYYENALEIGEKTNDIDCVATNNYNIGLTCLQQSKMFYAINYMQKALSLWQQLGEVKKVLTAYANIINCYTAVDEYDLAKKYALESLELALETGNRFNEADLYDRLAAISQKQGEIREVVKYYQFSINIFEELGEQLQVARVSFNAAQNQFADNPEIAVKLYRKSASIYENIQPRNNALFYIYYIIAEHFKKEHLNDSVRFFYEKALDKAILSGTQTVIADAHNILGRYYLEINEIKTAEKCFLTAYELASKINQIKMMSDALTGLSDINARFGDYRTAFKYIKQNQTFKDSLNNEENRKNILQLNTVYEFDKENNAIKMQLAHQEQDIRQQKNIKRIILIALFCSGILLIFLIRSARRNKEANIILEDQYEEITSINDELNKSNSELSHYKDHLEEMVKEQTEKLFQKEMQLRTLSDNLPGGYIYQISKTPDGKESISYIGSNAEKWIGASIEAVMDDVQLMYRQIFPDDLERKRNLEKESISTMSSYSFEYRVMIDNQEIWMLENAIPLKEKNGNIIMDGIVMDITDHKQFEKELIRAKEHAEESDKLKSAFLCNMSHEIRTPMNGIVGFLSFIERDDLPADKRRTYIDIIRSNVQQLLQLIGDIVDISKMDSNQLVLQIVKFDMNALLDELEIFFQDFIIRKDKNLELILDRSDFISPCILKADPNRIKQILTNLIGNSIKFTEKGFIRFGYSLLEETSELYLFVEDTGIGIPESKMECIFERFRQANDGETQTFYGGTGLGLAISKNLVEVMGGHIAVESTEGTGTFFHFTLPFGDI